MFLRLRSAKGGGGEGGRLTDAFKRFFNPPQHPGLGNHQQRLHHMVQYNLGARADLETFPTEHPLGYWFMRMDHWPELAKYEMELLAFPASSMLSERTFSAAGGFVMDKSVSVHRLR